MSSRRQSLPIFTNGEDVKDLGHGLEPVSLKLGGIKLWAKSESELTKSIDRIRNAIDRSLAEHLTVARPVLKKIVEKKMAVGSIDKRIFSAVLGTTLRNADADCIVVSAQSDKPYRVYLGKTQTEKWRIACAKALALLNSKEIVLVRDLETLIFNSRAYNTWSSTLHVLARLSYLGTVEYATEDSFRLVRGI